MADFAEITIDPVVICKEEVRMTIKMKEPFWIIKELTLPDWPLWEEVELKTNRDLQVNSTLARLVFKLVQPGVLEIPPIRVRTDLDEFYTDPVRLEVLPQDTQRSLSTPDSIHPSDAYIVSEVSKNRVYLHEGVLLTDYLYSALWFSEAMNYETFDLGDFEGTRTIFNTNRNGWAEEIRQKEWKRVNERNYEVRPLRRLMLYPMEVGKVRLPDSRYTIEFILNKWKTPSLFEDYPEDEVKVRWPFASCILPELEVIPFPEQGKPADFEGMVEDFTITSSIGRVTGEEGKAEVRLTVEIRGVGSYPLLDYKPSIRKLPEGLSLEEVADDVQIEEVTEKGFACKKVITYRMNASVPGTYEIPAISFSFFDPGVATYRTVTTHPLSFTTTK